MSTSDICIIGAGIAGIATAHALAMATRPRRIVLIDRGPPLAHTTACSGENYRVYWPQRCMTELAAHSVSLMERLSAEHPNRFRLKSTGYLFVSTRPGHDIFPVDSAALTGVETVDGAKLRRRYPQLSERLVQGTWVRQAGSFDVHALGSLLLSRARDKGIEYRSGTVDELTRTESGFRISLTTPAGRASIVAEQLVLAAGPWIGRLAAQLGITLPIQNLLQRKIVMPDPDGCVARDQPFTILADPLQLDWTAEEAALIADEPDNAWLLDRLPPGLHLKPESATQIKLGWAYNRTPGPPEPHPPDDPAFATVVLKGAAHVVPGLAAYLGRTPTPIRQLAGYYTRTPENLPLIGPLGGSGLHLVGALSGFGTMMACAAGELAAAGIAGLDTPEYASMFNPDRYDDPRLVADIAAQVSDGQL